MHVLTQPHKLAQRCEGLAIRLGGRRPSDEVNEGGPAPGMPPPSRRGEGEERKCDEGRREEGREEEEGEERNRWDAMKEM